jgi:hypothetical protein
LQWLCFPQRLLTLPRCLQAVNPYLSPTAAAAVRAAAADWQELCVLADKLRRCQLCLPGAAVGAADGEADRTLTRLAEELSATTCSELDREKHPAWLAFQARSDTGACDLITVCIPATACARS